MCARILDADCKRLAYDTKFRKRVELDRFAFAENSAFEFLSCVFDRFLQAIARFCVKLERKRVAERARDFLLHCAGEILKRPWRICCRDCDLKLLFDAFELDVERADLRFVRFVFVESDLHQAVRAELGADLRLAATLQDECYRLETRGG